MHTAALFLLPVWAVKSFSKPCSGSISSPCKVLTIPIFSRKITTSKKALFRGLFCLWKCLHLTMLAVGPMGASLVFFCRFLFSPRSCWIGEICRFRCSKERGGGGGRVLWQLGQLTSSLPFRLNPPSLLPPCEQLHSIALQTQQAKGMVPLRLYKSAVWKWYSDCSVLYIFQPFLRLQGKGIYAHFCWAFLPIYIIFLFETLITRGDDLASMVYQNR